MAASFPTSIKSFTTKIAGDTVQPAHVNDVQDEVTAVETALLTSTSYTPTWGNTGTANTLGNGTITGAYVKMGKLVHFRVQLTWGSTTAAGSAGWTFTLPVTADSYVLAGGANGNAFDSGVGNYPVSVVNTSTTTFQVAYLLDGSATALSAVTATAPMTWATGDILSITGWYWAA